MQKVLIVNDLIKGGGVEKLLQDFAKRWHDKYDVTVSIVAAYWFRKCVRKCLKMK